MNFNLRRSYMSFATLKSTEHSSSITSFSFALNFMSQQQSKFHSFTI